MNKIVYYPPEWYPQDAVLLAWPNSQTDWRFNLDEAIKTYVAIVSCLSEYEKVIILCQNRVEVENKLAHTNLKNIHFLETNYNDTWTRDFGPITVLENETPKFLDFQFNGWGKKYDATSDNQVTGNLYRSSNIFNKEVGYLNMLDFVLEGGSIDTDGNGTLLTTSSCLLSSKRNTGFTKLQVEEKLKKHLGVKQVLWLNNGDIEGDDTDGHIDTLAKFCNEKTIVYATCDDENDSHYFPLKKMEEELFQLRTINNEMYNLIKIPLPSPIYNKENNRLPATYINFLITNKAVLMPAYNDIKDVEVQNILGNIFADKRIVSIDCLSLIQQYGSLHCITMQLPKATLKN